MNLARQSTRAWVVIFTLLSTMLFSSIASARTLILTAPPREKKEAGIKLYKPLADHLSKLLKVQVVYQHPGSWLDYQRDMREDKYDIVFDGPHFVSWRMEHKGHEVLVKLKGNLVFFLVVAKDDTEINSVSDMIAKRFCGISPPNLSTLSVIAAFPNPVRQPVIKPVLKGGMPAVYKTFIKGGKCRAMVLRNAYFKKKLTEEQRAGLRIIYTTKPLPNQAISASKRVSAKEKQLIIQSLTFGDGVKATSGILKRFGGKSKAFIKAAPAEFIGHNNLLEGVIFGW